MCRTPYARSMGGGMKEGLYSWISPLTPNMVFALGKGLAEKPALNG